MQESTTLAGESQANDDNGESQKPTASQLDQVAALLRGDESEQTEVKADDTPDGKPGESQKSGKPKSIKDVAERLGLDVAELFALELNMGETGERRTLGQLKDIAAEQDRFTVDKLQFEETKTKRETEFLRSQAELQDLIQMLPKHLIRPELLQTVAAKRAQLVEREKGLTLTAIPEWQDSDNETNDRAAMRQHLDQYGFSSNYLDSIADHRTLKYIRDNMQRQQRIERALAQVKQVHKPGHKPSAKPSSPVSPGSGKSKRHIVNQVAAVAELLKTG